MNPPNPPPLQTPPADDSRSLKGQRGLRRVLLAAGYSIDGLKAAWRHEDAFRQELILAAIMVPLALWLPLTLLERILLIAVVVLGRANRGYLLLGWIFAVQRPAGRSPGLRVFLAVGTSVEASQTAGWR